MYHYSFLTRLNDYGINYSDSYAWRSSTFSQPYLTYLRHVKHFHESPIVKYSYNASSYILFLLLFSYYLLFNFEIPMNETPSIHWTEILVIIIVTTMLIEEFRQVTISPTHFEIDRVLCPFSFSARTTVHSLANYRTRSSSIHFTIASALFPTCCSIWV
jgi:hypothetical protein